MRIIAGDFKGRRVEPVPGDGTRPTTDRVREAVASSVISNREGGFEGASVLDAFAGSGALGIEALSRGADRCTFVDASPKAVKTIEGNLAPLPLSRGAARVVKADAFALAGEGQARYVAGAPFDLVFLDPPYETGHREVAALMAGLGEAGLLSPGALVVYERGGGKAGKGKAKGKRSYPEAEEMAALLEGAFELVSVKSYGITQVVYFTYRQ